MSNWNMLASVPAVRRPVGLPKALCGHLQSSRLSACGSAARGPETQEHANRNASPTIGLVFAALMTLLSVVSAQAAPFAYISNRAAAGDVSVIDVATNTVVATVSTPGSPQGVAVHPDGTRVYVTNNPGTNIFVINTATNTVASSITVAANPIGVAINAAGTRAYVAHAGGTTVSVIDATNNTLLTTITVAAGPAGVAITPDGTRAYVTHFSGNTVSVIDTATNTVQTSVTVGAAPQGVAVTPDGTRVYVTNTTPDSVSVISTATNTVVATVTGFNTPYAVSITPDGSRAYVSSSGGNTVDVITTATNTLTASVPIGTAPRGVSVTPDGSRVYVANTTSNDVSVVSTATNTVTATIPVGSGPYAFGQFIGGPVPGTPAISVTGTTTFPATTVGGSSGVQPITITNSGTANLSIASISHSGPANFPDTTSGPPPNAAHYCGFGSTAGGAPQTGGPIVLAPAASCTLNLIYAATAVGAQAATITVNSNAPTSPTAINLSGTGSAPTSTLAPAAIAFGNVPITLPVNQTGTFTNNSSTPYTLTAFANSDARFTVTGNGASPCNVGTVVNGGASCTYQATFTPTGTGSYNNTLTISFTSGGVATVFSQSQNSNGTGYLLPFTQAPASISFGNVPRSLPVSQTYTFTNTSNSTPFPTSYTINSFNVSGLGFTAVGSGGTPCNIGTVLAPAASCTVSATITATGPGSTNGTVDIGFLGGLGANPQYTASLSLNANGYDLPFTLAPGSVSFGSVPVGLPVNQNFTFTNTSNSTPFPTSYTINSFSVGGLGFTAVGSGATPCNNGAVLAPGTSCTVTATITATGTGSTNGTVSIGFLGGLGSNPQYTATENLNAIGVNVAPTITSGAPPGGFVGTPYSFNFTANGSAPITWTIATGTPPNGLTLSSAGLLSGTPTLAGTFNFTVQAANGTLPNATQAQTISVTNTCGVTEVTNTNDAGACSLRGAIDYANTNCGSGPYTITFNIVGAGGPYTIAPVSELPPLTCNGTVVNGYSQPGASANSTGINVMTIMPTSLTTNLQVILDGSGLSLGRGLTVTADNVSVRGLAIRSFPYEGIFITGNNARIEGNFIGTDPGGMTAFGNGFAGIKLAGGTGTRIGGSTAQVNLITGNTFAGIQVFAPASNFQIWSNRLGGDRAGGSMVSGGGNGAVEVYGGMSATNMGGDVYSNIIHYNAGSAVWVDPNALNVSITENSMFSLGAKGINLNGSGNNGLPPPVLTQVTYSATGTNIIGNFTALSPGVHQLDVYANPAQGALPIGQVYAQNFSPTASIAGATPFNITSGANIINLSATATQIGTGTSEFSVVYQSPLSISPASIAPFNVLAGAATSYQTFTVTNISSANLTFGAVPYAVPMGGYVIGTESCANATLVPMGTCSYQIGFASPVAGTFGGNASLNIVQGAVSTIYQQSANATATVAAVPIFSPSATTLTFPGQTVGSTSAAQTITITNTGSGVLNFGASSIGGPFNISGNTCTGVAPMLTCTVQVTFSPFATGAAIGSLTLNTDAAGSPHLIALNGTGIAPTTAFSPTSYNHGTVTVGSSNSLIGTFTNTSGSTITLGNPFATPNAASFTIGGGMVAPCTNGMVLPTMTGCTFISTFTPAGAGLISSTYTFNFTAGMQSFSPTVVVDGTGAAASSPTMTVAFAPTSVNTGVNATLTFTLTNPTASGATISIGSAVATPGLTLSSLTDSCGLGAFISTGSVDFGMAGLIPAMSTCTVTVQAKSATPGVYPVTANPGNLVTNLGNNANTSTATLTVNAVATGPFAYIPIFTSFSGSTVSVIDLPTNTLATTITVGAGPVGAAVNYAGTKVYISNQQSNSISVIDTASNTVVATVGVGSQPGSASVNPAGTRVYVPNQSSASLSVIDATTNSVIATITGLSTPVATAVHPSGAKAYVALNSSNSLGVIDAATNTLSASIPVCSAPYQPVVNGAGTRVYVVCTSGSVSVVDTGTASVIATIPVGTNARGIALTGNGAQAWVTNTGSNNVSVIDTATNTVTATLIAGSSPWGVAGNAAGTRMYVANNASNSVTVFDTGSNAIVATVPVGVGPLAVGQFVQPAAVVAAPALALTPSTLAFGVRTVNTTSPLQVVTLSNSGTAPLVISSITGSGDYAFTTTCPISTPPIAPAGTCTVSITFTPLTAAALSGSIAIASNAPGSPHVINLSGTGVAVGVTNIAVSPTSLDFGTVTIATASQPYAVTVSNTGFANLLLSGITVSGPFARTSRPSVPPDCGASVAPGAACSISLVFTPAVPGAASGQLSITHNASGSPSLVALTGLATAVPVPVLSVAARVVFADQIINTATSLALNLSNTGTATLNIGSIVLFGSSDFTQSGTCRVVAAGGSCVIDLGFRPSSVGARAAQLDITSNTGSQSPVTNVSTSIAISGNGILAPRPAAEVSLTAVGFGNAIFGGATTSQLVKLKSVGSSPLEVRSIFTSGADFVQMNSCAGSLPTDASCLISVAFSPLGMGAKSGELQMVTNAIDSPHKVQLSGTGCRWFSQTASRFFITSCGN